MRRLSEEEIREALLEPVQVIVENVKNILEKTPPELAADIIEKGILMTGGGALLDGLDKLIEINTGVSVRVANNSVEAVVEGTGKVLEYMKRSEKKSSYDDILLID